MNSFAVLLLCFQACLVQNAMGQCYGAAEVIAPACGGAYGYGLGGNAYGYGLGGAAYGYGLGGNAYGYGLGGPEFAAPFAYGAYEAAYGGEGVGDVAVIGELPVAGTTLVAGQVPILGAVEFGGIVPAAGEVSIAGRCAGGCGCGGPFFY